MNIFYKILQILNSYSLAIFILGVIFVYIFNFHYIREKNSSEVQRRGVYNLRDIQNNHRISILVGVWNEASLIERYIKSFIDLRNPQSELILCAGGTDGTYEIAKRFSSEAIIVIEQIAGEGKQRSLQHCLEYASGDIIYLTDADSEFDRESFERILAPFIIHNLVAISGMTKPLFEQFDNPFVIYQWYAEQYSSICYGELTQLLRGCNAVIRRDILEVIGGFQGDALIGTDEHLSRRLINQNIPIHFIRDSMIANEYPNNFKSYSRQQARWLRVALIGSFNTSFLKAWPIWKGFLIYFAPVVLLALGPLCGTFSINLGLLILLHMFFTRLRIIKFGNKHLHGNYKKSQILNLLGYILYDVYIRIISVLQLIHFRSRWRW